MREVTQAQVGNIAGFLTGDKVLTCYQLKASAVTAARHGLELWAGSDLYPHV